MLQLNLFTFLLMQASMFGIGLLAAGATALVLLRSDRSLTARLLILPLIWLGPLALAGLFAEPGGPKTADWMSNVAIGTLFVYLAAAIWSVATLWRVRYIAIACALINAPFVLFSSFVQGCAAAGSWP